MKTYTLELTALEMGMLSAVADIARGSIENAAPYHDTSQQRRDLAPLFAKIRAAAQRIYREEHGTASRG